VYHCNEREIYSNDDKGDGKGSAGKYYGHSTSFMNFMAGDRTDDGDYEKHDGDRRTLSGLAEQPGVRPRGQEP